MNEYIIMIFDDVNKETYTYIIQATNMMAAEHKAIAEHIECGLYISRLVTEGRI